MITRRNFVATSLLTGGLATFGSSLAFAAANTDRRLVFLIQRGAADGLATLAPTGDPDLLRARGDFAVEASTGVKLDSFFTLHPAMKNGAALFKSGEATFVHAVASGYRERSHFDAQNILESGGLAPYARKDGWLNRLLPMLPDGRAQALAVAPALPLALQGTAPAASYEQSRAGGPADDMVQRINMLYAEDAELSKLWEQAVRTEMMAGDNLAKGRNGTAEGQLAASLMKGANGARVLMMESDGWDTHSGQKGRLAARLKDVDDFVAALKAGLATDWNNTLVIVATEFGRTVAFNGTQGTDHGTASAAMLFGGALASGGKVIADWPGLAPAKLYEGRDLKPTTRFENMVSGALAHHYALDPGRIRKSVFPDFV